MVLLELLFWLGKVRGRIPFCKIRDLGRLLDMVDVKIYVER